MAHCRSGGTGRRARLRGVWGNPWGFESPLRHHAGRGNRRLPGRRFSFQHAALFLGLNLTSASRSTVLIFTQPVFTVVLAHYLVPGEALSVRRAAGTLVAFAGLVVVFSEGFDRGGWQTLTGNLLVTGNAVGWALQSIYTSRLILGDPVTAPLIVGLAVVAAGIALISRPASAEGLGKFK